MSNAGIVRPDDKRESCTCFPAFFFLQAIGFTGAGQVLHIPNYSVLSQELILAREIAYPSFPEFEEEIFKVFELANELVLSLWSIDTLIEAMEFNQAIRTGEKFMVLANRLFSLEPHIKRLFSSPDKLVSWRRSPTDNILQAIESEARDYFSYFRYFLSYDWQVDEEDAFLSLKSQIRQRAAKDDNSEINVIGHNPRNVDSEAGKPKHGASASGQSRNNVPQPTEVSEFYRLQRLPKWQGKWKAEIHREIARRNAKKTKRPWTDAELLREAERIKKAIRDYERKVNQ